MTSLDTLPGDQRAVLELVVQRGRGYEEIERLLSIDRTAVRARALAALDAIGPWTSVPPARRALIADYLLGQLPPRVGDEVRRRLSEFPEERAWARAVAAELAPVAAAPLPEIPSEPAPATPASVSEVPSDAAPAREPVATAIPQSAEPTSGRSGRPSSRVGGAVVLGAGALIAVAVAVVLLTRGGSNPSPAASSHTPTKATGAAAPSTRASGATSTTGTNAARVLGQSLMSPPGGGKGKAKGAAAVVAVGSNKVIELAAYGLTPNKHTTYAVWLYNSPADEYRVGYYSPGVGRDGRLLTRGLLPTNTAHYKHLLLALEPVPAPNRPTNVVLEGALSIP
ncbi:MAG TPA: hypothetical protein VIX82_03600 [Solirubrobacteraceae bacterium]